MKIKNDLVLYSLSEYESCLEEISNILMKQNFIVSVYKFGNINFPGISDIDILIVIDNLDNYKIKRSIILDYLKCKEIFIYLFFHEPIIVTREDLKFMHLFHSAENLLWKEGEKINLKRNFFEKEECLMWNSYFIINFLLLMKKRGNVSLRYTLLLLNNLAYTIKSNDSLLKTNLFQEFKISNDNIRRLCTDKQQNLDDRIFKQIEFQIKKGFILLKKQETLRSNNGIYIRLDIKKRIFFVNYKYPIYINLYLFKLIALPSEYFQSKDVYIKKIKKLFENKNLGINEIMATRERFQSVFFLDF